MAYIGHRCGCGHMDIRHELKKDGTRGSCSCSNRCRKSTTATVAPSFDPKGRTVERIVPPGERLGNVVPTCSCDACEALYAELTGAAADSG